jgi:hypothetical protein
MSALGSAAVDVVTAGVDWPAVAASISTGVAAVAGISATLWVATRSWNRDERRAKEGVQRGVYRACLAALQSHVLARINYLGAVDTDEEQAQDNAAAASWLAAWTAVTEAGLIAPGTVYDLARTALRAITDWPGGDEHTYTDAFWDLQNGMRVDLGEKPLSKESAGATARSAQMLPGKKPPPPDDGAAADNAQPPV